MNSKQLQYHILKDLIHKNHKILSLPLIFVRLVLHYQFLKHKREQEEQESNNTNN